MGDEYRRHAQILALYNTPLELDKPMDPINSSAVQIGGVQLIS